jgi:1,4-dihydroxy-6-naphthoate synthase
MQLKLGFSTCPNDTFIFEALVNNRIDGHGLDFNLHLADVEELNKLAFNEVLDITKISIAAYPKIADKYLILDSGGALGNNNGPLLISKRKINTSELNKLKIAIPGFNTTANLLLSIAYPKITNKEEYIFNEIETAILNNKVDAGLIIHESRFTYEKRGLLKVADLGEFWESQFNRLVPLGCIVIKRSLPKTTIELVNRMISESVSYAFNKPEISREFIKQNAQELDDDVIKKHIELYVNRFSIDLGPEGREAIKFLFQKGNELRLLPAIKNNIFIDN